MLPERSTVEARERLRHATEGWLAALAAAALPAGGCALIAVGGLGRGELCAGSDLDLLLLHATNHAAKDAGQWAQELWYPVWDAGLRLDHATRNPAEARALAGQDVKVLLGLLDARTLWGDASLLDSLRGSVLADWRAQAQQRLPALRQSVEERRLRAGDLSHLLEPDLKEAYGGLRETTVLRAVAASWLVDQPRAELASAHSTLLTVRDALHRVTGRGGDRLVMAEQAAVAELQGFESDDALLRAVSSASRRIANASDELWHRLDRQLRPRRGRRLRGPAEGRRHLAEGVVCQAGEAVLAEGAAPAQDSGLAWRAAAAAAQNGLWLNRYSLERIVKEGQPPPIPWPLEVRQSLVSLLGAGPALVPVWEALDAAGVIERSLPHWAAIRSLPQRNSLHVYTVDRHSVETAVQAAALTREVARPDLLLVAALFHDIGKGQPGHCERGADLMREIAPTLGFGPADSHTLELLVRHHLLLAEVATGRDLDEPATVDSVQEAVGTVENLELLHALTLADSAAAAPNVLTPWKRRLLADLVARVRASFAGEQPAPAPSLASVTAVLPSSELPVVSVAVERERVVVRLQAEDRIGLLAAVAGGLALQRLEVESAVVDTVAGVALQEWSVQPIFGTPPDAVAIREELLRALSGQLNLAARLASLRPLRPARGFTPPPPKVEFLQGAATSASVLRVRAHDAPALLFRVAEAVSGVGASVSAAKAATLGSEVVDVLYLTRTAGGPLGEAEEQAVLAAVAAALR